MPAGKLAFSCGNKPLDPVNHLNGIRARLPLNVYDDGRRLVHPRRQLRVLNIVDHVARHPTKSPVRHCYRQ